MDENRKYRFKVDENLRKLLACDEVFFVHDDGIYLVAWDKDKTRYMARPENGNLGLDPGHGDDFSEPIAPVELPDSAITFFVDWGEMEYAIGWGEPA